ncbi:MAG: hypothetical protein GF364_12290, partial [Candidatus Lokiarchaeota archaeon]|nr:hypothetical protein [Candidatus Lokiarchaeota archaeon]
MRKKKLILGMGLMLFIVLFNLAFTQIYIIDDDKQPIEINESPILTPLDSGIDSEDKLSGLGDNLTADEYAKFQNKSQYIEGLENATYDQAYINITEEWTGYELFTEVSSLSDNRTWQTDGGVDTWKNWSYDERDFEDYDDSGDNENENCFGNWTNAASTPGTTDTGSLKVGVNYNGPGDQLNTTEYAAFNQTINFTRGEVSYCRLDFATYNNGNPSDICTAFIDINGYKVDYDAFSAGDRGSWVNRSITVPTSELASLFSGGETIYVKVGIDTLITALWNDNSDLGNTLYYDNISLWIRAEAKPQQINLTVNETGIVGNNYGIGNGTLLSEWDNPSSSVPMILIANFSTNSSDVQFETDLTLYLNDTKSTQDYNGDPYTEFFVKSGQQVNWTSYFYGSRPTPSHSDYNYTMYFPTDWVPWSAINPIPAEVVNDLTIDTGSFNAPISISNDFPGTWEIGFNSPNYVQEVRLYRNTTDTPQPNAWEEVSSLFAGDYLNVTAKIKPDGLIGNLEDTSAMLTIKFPNGSIWVSEQQIKEVYSNVDGGMVYFDEISIP